MAIPKRQKSAKGCKSCTRIKKRQMKILYEDKYFVVIVPKPPHYHPHINRKDGGHLGIIPKSHVVDRSQLTPAEGLDLVMLSMVVGEAFYKVMPKRGIQIKRINYQDNGNFSVDKACGPHMDLHIYGRAKDSVDQVHGQALYFPKSHSEFYKHTKPLTNDDAKALKAEIKRLLKIKKYKLMLNQVKSLE